MTPYDHGGVALDLCCRCHGIWFDSGELGKVEDVAVELVPVKGSDAPSLPCPRCPGHLREGKLPGSHGLLLDQCGQCRGLFLDAGELRRLRQHKAAARSAAAEEDARSLREFAERRERDRGAPRAGDTDSESAWASARNLVAFFLDLPVEEDSWCERNPYATWGLLGLLTAIWIWQAVTPEEAWMGLAAVPADISAGRGLHTLLTAAFIHGGWLHLLGNAYFLWTFGDDVEERLGSWAFAPWYLLWALAGSAAFVVMAAPAERAVPGLGASGAIAGVMGAYLVLFPHRRLIVPDDGLFEWCSVKRTPAWAYLGLWVACQSVGALLGLPDVGWWAHLGGFVAGAAVAAGYRATAGRST